MKKIIFSLIILSMAFTFGQNQMYIWKNNVVTDSMAITNDLKISFKSITTPPLDGLVAYYPFNNNTNDESGNGLNISNYNAVPTTDRFSQQNKAYNFDGTIAYMTIPDATKKLTFDARTESYSMSLWINLSAKPSRHIHFIMDRSYTGPWAYYLNYSAIDNSLTFGPFDGVNTTQFFRDTLLQVNKWYHFAVVYSLGNSKLYIDGNLVSNKNLSSSFGSSKRTTDLVLIGAFTDPTGIFYDKMIGKIDDIRIYKRALTDSEILTLYHESGWTGN